MMRLLPLICAGLLALMFPALVAAAGPAGHAGPPFDLSPAAVAFDGSSTLLVALRIQNNTPAILGDVRITRFRLDGLSPDATTVLPELLGDMAADGIATIQANFNGQFLVPGRIYRLHIHGSHAAPRAGEHHPRPPYLRGRDDDDRSGQSDDRGERDDRERVPFTLNTTVEVPVASGTPLPSHSTTAVPVVVSGGGLPKVEPVLGDRNEALLPPVPRSIAAGQPMPAALAAQVVQPTLSSPSPGLTSIPARAVQRDPLTDPVVFITDTALGTNLVNGSPPDMSEASVGQLAFETYNTSAALSTSGGASFTTLDPTTIFPSAAVAGVQGGFCCDQQVIYVPQIDRIIWLMQFWPTGASGAQSSMVRIAAASPADIIASGGTFWTYWDLSSGTFNLNGNWMDYPALAYGNNFLYMTINALGGSPGGGRLVVRMPLAQLRDGASLGMNYIITPNGCYPTQNAGGTVYWAAHNNNHQMRVWSWDETSNQIFPHDVDIHPWPNDNNGSATNPYVSIAPNGNDWTEAEWTFPGCTRGATQRLGPGRHPGDLFGNELWFAWTATPGGGFPNVHIQVVSIDPVDFSLISQDQIWNADHAFAYESLTSNAANEIGVAAAWGGGKYNENSAVGIFGDRVLYSTGASEDSQGRWGDYVIVRKHSPNDALFSAATYSTKTAADGGFQPQWILFGRQSALNPPPPPH